MIQKDRQLNRERYTYRVTERKSETERDIWIDRHTKRQTDVQRQIDVQREREPYRETDRRTERKRDIERDR